jgi:hypothetical protein
VFEAPGWDLLPRAKAAGFSDAYMRFIGSESAGILNDTTGLFVFVARK